MTEAMIEGMDALIIYQEDHYPKSNEPVDEVHHTMKIIEKRIQHCCKKYETQQDAVLSKKQQGLNQLQQSLETKRKQLEEKLQKDEAILRHQYEQESAQIEMDAKTAIHAIQENRKKELQLYTTTVLAIVPPTQTNVSIYDWVYQLLFK